MEPAKETMCARKSVKQTLIPKYFDNAFIIKDNERDETTNKQKNST